MNEAEARELARKFVQNLKLPVSEITAVRRVRFDHAEKGKRDLWVICFARPTGPGMEYPGESIVEIDYASGHAELFSSFHADEGRIESHS
jgi:hypothetical protein